MTKSDSEELEGRKEGGDRSQDIYIASQIARAAGTIPNRDHSTSRSRSRSKTTHGRHSDVRVFHGLRLKRDFGCRQTDRKSNILFPTATYRAPLHSIPLPSPISTPPTNDVPASPSRGPCTTIHPPRTKTPRRSFEKGSRHCVVL